LRFSACQTPVQSPPRQEPFAELAGQAAGTLGGLAAAADDNCHRAMPLTVARLDQHQRQARCPTAAVTIVSKPPVVAQLTGKERGAP
jgi:hypothetical protein